MIRTLAFGAALAALATAGIMHASAQTKSPDGAAVYIVSPQNGATVKSPFKVVFGLTGMGIAPAGVDKPNTGHHHLIIDAKLSADEIKAPLITDAQHVHFGAGQTETSVSLAAGQHTLQLVLGDQNHMPHEPPVMSQVVTVTVQ